MASVTEMQALEQGGSLRQSSAGWDVQVGCDFGTHKEQYPRDSRDGPGAGAEL